MTVLLVPLADSRLNVNEGVLFEHGEKNLFTSHPETIQSKNLTSGRFRFLAGTWDDKMGVQGDKGAKRVHT